MNKNLSKSRYTQGIRCPKCLWLSIYKKEEGIESSESILENGQEVGDLARHLFGDDYKLINFNYESKIMIDETKKHLEEKDNIICEASFDYDGNFCAVDILKNNKSGFRIMIPTKANITVGIIIDKIDFIIFCLSINLNIINIVI